MQTGTRIEEIFEQAGALRDGHFLLKSGRHSARYVEKFAVLQHPSMGVEICRRSAEALAPFSPTVVVGPTTGGVLLAFETARQLGGGVRGIFAEPVEGGRLLRRGWELSAADRVVLVDDILTTGASLLETADAVREAGPEPLAATVIVDRSTAPIEAAFPIISLGTIEIPTWPAADCPLCASGLALTKHGSS